MFTFKEIKEKIRTRLSEERFEHTLSVVKTAEILAKEYNASIEDAQIAALLHDIAKEESNEFLIEKIIEKNQILDLADKLSPRLLHARVGAIIAQEEFKINNNDILMAIASHTLGRPKMSLLEEIIFIADAIEPTREEEWITPINKALKEKGLKGAVLEACKKTIEKIIRKNWYLHPLTVETYNYYL